MSRNQAQPRQGHLERLRRIYAYVIRTKDYATRSRTTEPDYSYLPHQNFDWAHTTYGHVQEIIPDGIPDPLGIKQKNIHDFPLVSCCSCVNNPSSS